MQIHNPGQTVAPSPPVIVIVIVPVYSPVGGITSPTVISSSSPTPVPYFTFAFIWTDADSPELAITGNKIAKINKRRSETLFIIAHQDPQ